jgi:hypothetical protein
MAEPLQYGLDMKEVAAALVKQLNIKEGIWQVTINFGFGAANFGESIEKARPSAVIQVLGVGLMKVDAETEISVDASKVRI